MATVTKNNNNNTVLLYDNFYNTQISVSTNEYNLVSGFFLGVCDTKQIADNFTSFLFEVAKRSNIDPITLLQTIKGENNKLKVDQKLAYYLNSFKSKSSLYGVAVVPRPVQPVARNIIR